MKAVSIEGKLEQSLAAASLTETLRSKFNLTSPHDCAKGVLEFCDRYGLDPHPVMDLMQAKLLEIQADYFEIAARVLENKIAQRLKEKQLKQG